MIEYESVKIRSYENFIRDVINISVIRIDLEKLDKTNKMFTEKVKELFKLENNNSWSFLTSSLDVLGDSTFAIVSFMNHKIDNGKVFNTGEKYLRVYGVLSGVYIHFRAISTLADLVKTKTNEMEKEFKELDISFLRNVISAHPVNYDENGKKKNFKIARHSINNFGNLEIVNMQNEFNSFNLFDSIELYIQFAENELDKIARKLVHNRYKSSKSKLDDYLEKLERIKYI